MRFFSIFCVLTAIAFGSRSMQCDRYILAPAPQGFLFSLEAIVTRSGDVWRGFRSGGSVATHGMMWA